MTTTERVIEAILDAEDDPRIVSNRLKDCFGKRYFEVIFCAFLSVAGDLRRQYIRAMVRDGPFSYDDIARLIIQYCELQFK